MSAQAPDVYFDERYGSVVAGTEGGRWHLISLDEGRWQIPLVVRDLASGRRDAISPYGYAGAFWQPTGSNATADELWSETRLLLDHLGIVSMFLRISPLVPQAAAPPDAVPIVSDHWTYLVPSNDVDQAWAKMDGRARTAIRKARKLGFTSELRSANADDLVPSSPFRELYSKTMQKVEANSYYFFEDDYFDGLGTSLGGDLLLGVVRDADGAPHAAALFMSGRHYLHYHLSGSSQEGARAGASNLLIWDALQETSRRSLSGLHLGGGLVNGDGLDRFKKSFGGEALSYNAYGVIVNNEAYTDEVAMQAQRLGTTSNSLLTPGFFPSYRRAGAPHDRAE